MKDRKVAFGSFAELAQIRGQIFEYEEDILNWARLESGQKPMVFDTLPIPAMVERNAKVNDHNRLPMPRNGNGVGELVDEAAKFIQQAGTNGDSLRYALNPDILGRIIYTAKGLSREDTTWFGLLNACINKGIEKFFSFPWAPSWLILSAHPKREELISLCFLTTEMPVKVNVPLRVISQENQELIKQKLGWPLPLQKRALSRRQRQELQ